MDIGAARQIMATRGWLPLTPPTFRTAVLERVVLRSLDRGEAAYHSGDEGGGVWGLVKGSAALLLDPTGYPEAPAHLLSPGQWIGAGPLILGGNRRLGLVVKRPSAFLTLSTTAFHQILAVVPDGWRSLAIIPSLNALLAAMGAEDLMIRDPRRRTAAILLRLSGCRGPYAHGVPDDVALTQGELAEAINLSRTVLGEILRDFERRGAIHRRYGVISVDRHLLEGLHDRA